MKRLILKFLIYLTGNRYGQLIVEKMFILTTFLLGIGTGSFPAESGEKSIFDFLLKVRDQNNDDPYIIFDVGANIGQFLELALTNLEGKKLEIYAFEPAREAYQALKKKHQTKSFIRLENLGLDNKSHRAKIYYEQPRSLRASKYQRDLRHLDVEFNQSEPVNFITLDEYCVTNQVKKIDLLKIDVEGNELNVLKGGIRMLEEKKISLITFEFGRSQIDSRVFFKDVYYFLCSYKMEKLFRILANGYLKPIDEYDESCEIFFPANYLAIMNFES